MLWLQAAEARRTVGRAGGQAPLLGVRVQTPRLGPETRMTLQAVLGRRANA